MVVEFFLCEEGPAKMDENSYFWEIKVRDIYHMQRLLEFNENRWWEVFILPFLFICMYTLLNCSICFSLYNTIEYTYINVISSIVKMSNFNY